MQANMSPQYISFCKTLLRSHISIPYQLTLPRKFCDEHLQCHDNAIILVDESERDYSVKFSMKRNQLGYGWRDFVKAHGLLEGDALSFHLIDRCKFKVHITRASRSIENEFLNDTPVDFETQKKMEAGATNELSNLPSKKDFDKMEAELKAALDRNKEPQMQLDVSSAHVEKLNETLMDMEKEPKPLEDEDSKEDMVDRMLCRTRKRVSEEIVLKEHAKHVCIRSRSTETNDADGDSSLNVDDSSNDIHLVAPLGIENSETDLNFNDVKGFEDFKIRVNGEILDSEIPADIRMKYYQLCYSQKKFLHDRSMKGLNSKLVVAMILEIVSIADSTKAASISNYPHDLERMGKALKSFQDLGMAVGSLRAKIGALTKFSSEHQTVEESTRVKLAELERERTAFQEKKSKIDELIESAMAHGELIAHLEEKVDNLKEKREKLRFVFKEVAGLTW